MRRCTVCTLRDAREVRGMGGIGGGRVTFNLLPPLVEAAFHLSDDVDRVVSSCTHRGKGNTNGYDYCILLLRKLFDTL